MTLSAGVSEASTQPSGASAGPSRPRHSGRNPWGSRTPNSRSELMRTNENAPSRMGSTNCRAVERSSVSGKDWAKQLGHDVAVGGDGAGQHPDLLGQGGRVGQVPVVAQREAGAAHRAVDGLGPRPVRGAVRRVAGVADGQVALEPREGALVEDGRHQAHVLDDRHRVAVAHRHAGRLLPAVLQREQAVEREVGHPHPGRVDTEDTACFLHAAPILAQARDITGRPGPGPGWPRAPPVRRRRGGRPGRPR